MKDLMAHILVFPFLPLKTVARAWHMHFPSKELTTFEFGSTLQPEWNFRGHIDKLGTSWTKLRLLVNFKVLKCKVKQKLLISNME